MTCNIRSLLAAVAVYCFTTLTTVASIVGLLSGPAQAATVQSAGFTTMGTFEVVLQDDIFANTSGEVTVNAPVGPGVMGVNFLLITPGFFTNTANPSLFEGTSLSRTYSNPEPFDGTVAVAVGWLDSAWEDFSSWSTISNPERTAFLDNLISPEQGAAGLFDNNCVTSCTSGGGGDTGGGGGISPVPLPAAGWLLLGVIAGLGALTQRRTAT